MTHPGIIGLWSRVPVQTAGYDRMANTPVMRAEVAFLKPDARREHFCLRAARSRFLRVTHVVFQSALRCLRTISCHKTTLLVLLLLKTLYFWNMRKYEWCLCIICRRCHHNARVLLQKLLSYSVYLFHIVRFLIQWKSMGFFQQPIIWRMSVILKG